MLRRVRRAMALTTVCVAMVCVAAGPARAELGDPDPSGGSATTSTTVDTTPTTDPSSDPTTTTTTTPTDPSTTTTTAPADNDSGATTSSSSSTTTTGPGSSTTSTSIPSSGGSSRSTTTSRPSSTTTTAPGSTGTTTPAPSPAGVVVPDLTAGDQGSGGDSHASGSSGGSGRSTHPSPTRPEKSADKAAIPPPDPNWFDASGLGGLFGVGAVANQVPAGETPEPALTDSESALPSRDHGTSSSSAALLGLSLLALLALAGGAAYRWWDHRPARYWPA